MIRASLRLAPWRRSHSQAPIKPASTATSIAAGTNIAAPRSDARCDGASPPELSFADVAASERNRCHFAEIDNGPVSTPLFASAATARCTAGANVAARSPEVGRADVARRTSTTVCPPLSGCNQRARVREPTCSDKPARTSSTFAALGAAGSAFEATAPVLSFDAVS
jgi:hypothetical protein